jgi:hypothetical protein
MSWTPVIRTLADGEGATASNINRAVNDLASRTTWLRSQLESLAVGESLVLQDQTVGAAVENGQPVYLDAGGVFQPAVVEVDPDNLAVMGPRTRWQGIATGVSALSANIVIGGQATLTPATWASQMQDGVFVAGDLFLSAVTPGKMVGEPGSTGVFIGHVDTNGRLLVRASSTGTFVDHVHIGRSMVGDPADDAPADPAPGDPQLIIDPDPTLRGWLPANSTYFPGFTVGTQIPTGAVFGYNIQHPDEADLRAVFPMVPEDNAQFYQGVEALTPDTVVINAYGIWWMTNAYGEAPWPVDYVGGPTAALDVRLWTTRLTGGASLFDTISAKITQQLSVNAQSFAVTRLESSDPQALEITGTNTPRGDLVLTPAGVNRARARRGMRIAGSLGNAAGWRGLVDFEVATEVEATHLWTELADPGDKLLPVSTNGFSAGVDIGLRAHRLGDDVGDFIDFLVVAGQDLPAATNYRPVVRIHAAVDVPVAAPTVGQVEVRLYVLSPGQPMSSSALVRTEQAAFTIGQPGRLQQADLGPFVDVNLQRNQRLLVRLVNSTGGSPLPGDTLRVLGVYAGLTPS